MKTKLLALFTIAIIATTGAQTLYTVHDYDDCKTLAFVGNTTQTDRAIPVNNPDVSDTANPKCNQIYPKVKKLFCVFKITIFNWDV
jgi:hypothetical protein